MQCAPTRISTGMKAIILAGGSGTRLWPLSRASHPKQFLRLNGDKSLLQQTVERTKEAILLEDIIVLTNNDYKFHVKADLNFLSETQIVLEPLSKNTAPAIALGVRYCLEKLGCCKDEIIFVSPSDHIIKPVDKFRGYLRQAEEIAKEGYIVTFGIKPSRAETGYGYIKAGDRIKMGLRARGLGLASPKSQVPSPKSSLQPPAPFFNVEEFTEKPDPETAKRYLEEGRYYWNSGMFVFSIGTIIEEFERYQPEIKKMLDLSFNEIVSNFNGMPDISIDYAIAEKSESVVTLPLDIYWNDIGSWDSLYDVLDKDEDGNVKQGDIVSVDTMGSMIIGSKRLISTIGLEDIVIVETDDAIMIAKKGETQKVKDVVHKLKKDGRRECVDHVTTYRPWGNYTILEEGPRYKIKRIVVNSNQKLSLQMHYHRSEHWVVVRGTARIIIGDNEKFIHENESAYVPKSTPHRLENQGKVPLEIIEVQSGEYLEEDDIVRFDDIYGR